MRVSTIVLIVAFLALFWVYHNFEPRPAPSEAPTTAVVPPGFVPDPELHVGAADQRPAAPGIRDHHHDHDQPDGDHDVTGGDHQPDVADHDGGSWAAGAADRHAVAHPHADDAVGARVGTGADHAGCAELAISGFRRRHRYTGVP